MSKKKVSKESQKSIDLVENVGGVIRNVREQKRLSQKEVASAIGVDPTQYNRIELGKSLPTLKTIAKIAKALDVSVDSLISEQGALDVEIKDKSLFDKVKLIDSLPEEEKSTVLKVIDLALSKKKFKDLLQQVA